MQKTEKHCKNQCFCYHKTTKISPKTGPKTQKSASGPGHLRNRKKRCCKPKNWSQKSWKARGFFTFRLPILDGRVHEQASSVLFFTVFFEGERHDLSKTGGFGRKMPPPGKPVTFYECHPEDHAPAPSVRADFVVWHIALLVVGFQLRDCRQCVMYKSTDILQVCVSYVHWFEDLIISSGLFRDDFRSASSGLWGARYEEGKSPGSEVKEGLGWCRHPCQSDPIPNLLTLFLHFTSLRFNRSTQARLHQSPV